MPRLRPPTPRQLNLLLLAAALIVLPPLLSRAMPETFTGFRALMIGVSACYAAAALSLNVLMGYAGQISLGHGAFLAVGAFASGLITTRGPETSLVVGLLLGALLGAVFAFLVGVPALRLRGLYLAIATIGFAFMMEESFFRWRPITRGSAGLELPRRIVGDQLLVSNADYLPVVLVGFLLVWLVDVNLTRSKLGRAFQGIREDEAVAASFGVDVTRYKLLAFVVSGALAGFAGAMYGHLIGFVNSSTFDYDSWSLFLVVLVVVGGLADRRGVVVAAVFFALMPRLLQRIEGWDLIIGSGLLVFTMARHPGGFAEAIKELRHRRKAPEVEAADPSRLPTLIEFPRPKETAKRSGVLLDVRDVTVRFGGLVAVNNASMKVDAGQIVGLIGPNGAGKTTLFNAISGLVTPDAGTVEFAGSNLGGLPPHARAQLGLGRTFQMIGLAKNLSVLENFLLAQHSQASYSTWSALAFTPGAAAVERDLIERSRNAIRALGFEQYTDTAVKHLSHGQQRLVELGCALVTAPDLLMLDEPSAGFSPAAVESLSQRLREIRDDLGRTILLIEHNIPLVLDICDYLYVLNFGEVLAHGPGAEIASHPEVVAAYLGESSIDAGEAKVPS